MKVDKLSISLDSNLSRRVRLSAERSGKGLSEWIAEAVQARLRSEGLMAYLAAWEAKQGPLNAADIRAAERAFGLASKE